jgi:ribosome-binding protein aMBF1 (putative translation factor)
MGDAYREVWQTWHLVRPVTRAPLEERGAPSSDAATPSTAESLRHRVQTARVERRWSISALAARVGMDPETIASFERGDDVLAPEQQQRVRAVLQV